MCAVSGIIGGLSTIIGGLSAYAANTQQLENARAQSEYQAANARNEARLAQIQGEYARDKGEKDIASAADEFAATIGKIKAVRSASGVTLNGSPADLLVSAQKQYDYNVNNIREDVAREVWKYNVSAANSLNNANYIAGRNTGSSLGGLLGLVDNVRSGTESIYGGMKYLSNKANFAKAADYSAAAKIANA